MPDESIRCQIISSRIDESASLIQYLRDWRVPYQIYSSVLAAAAHILSAPEPASQWVVIIDEAGLNLSAETFGLLFSDDAELAACRLVLLGAYAPASQWRRLQELGFVAQLNTDASKAQWFSVIGRAPASTTTLDQHENVVQIANHMHRASSKMRYAFLVVSADTNLADRITTLLKSEAQEVFKAPPEGISSKLHRYSFDAVIFCASSQADATHLHVIVEQFMSALRSAKRPLMLAMIPESSPLEQQRWLAQGIDSVIGLNIPVKTIIGEVHHRRDQLIPDDNPPPVVDQSILDLTRLEELRQLGTDSGFVKALYRSFLSEAADLLHQLNELIRDGSQMERVPGIVESLQATAASVGFRRLAEECGRWHLLKTPAERQGFLQNITAAIKDAQTTVQTYVDTDLSSNCSRQE